MQQVAGMQQLGATTASNAPPGSSRLALVRQRPRRTAARPALNATPNEHQQVELNADSIRSFVAADPILLQLLGDPEKLRVAELVDGVINTVFAVHGSTGASAVIKQALPYVRAVGESFPLSRERMNVEAAAMQLLHSCCPQHIPQLLSFDPSNSVLAMQFLAPPHQKLLYCIRNGLELPGLAQQLAQLMAAVLAGGSLCLLTSDEAAATTVRFANTDIVAANEQVVLAGPFNPDDSSNRWTSPQLDGDVRALWADAAAMAAAADMLQMYRSCKQSLIHNDLHAGNLLAAPGSLFLIDWEFCTTGPVAFDIGCLLGNLLMAALALQGQDEEEQQAAADIHAQQQQQQHGRGRPARSRQDTARWLLQVMQEFWQRFVLMFPQHLAAAERAQGTSQEDCSSGGSSKGSRFWSEATQQQLLLADSCGFAGCCLIRLTIGLHHHPEIQAIAANRRAAVERRCLHLGQQLLKMRAATHAHVAAAAHGSGGADGGGPDDSRAEVLQSIDQVTALLVAATEGWL